MKKTIALFSVVALALAANVAFAGPTMNLLDADDSVFSQINARTSVFKVNHNAATSINSNFNIGGSSGNNALVAGDDLDAGAINTGSVTVIGSEQYDVNGLDVQYAGCACDGSDDVVLNGTDVDDSIAQQQNVEADEEEINSQTYTEANLNTNAFVETGANTGAAGGDLGEDSPIMINSGAANLQFDRIFVSDLVRVIRL